MNKFTFFFIIGLIIFNFNFSNITHCSSKLIESNFCISKTNLYNEVTFKGYSERDQYGKSLTCMSDVNGDGFDDIIISAQDMKTDTAADIGAVYIYLGGSTIDNVADIIITGTSQYERFGFSISSAGDINNDGFEDIIIGTPYYDINGFDKGKASIFLGGQTMDNIPDATILGTKEYEFLGYSVSGAGDINGDGFDDFIVGSPQPNSKGSISIYFGGTSIDTQSDIILYGEEYDDWFGNSISVGNINNDGFDDIIVSAYLFGQRDLGKVYIYYGGSKINSRADVVLRGNNYDNNQFGYSVSAKGDVNNDGYDDIIVGAPNDDTAAIDAGAVYIFHGGKRMNRLVDLIITGQQSYDYLGISLSYAEDINLDKNNDIIIGAHEGGFESNEPDDNGNAYILYGGKSMDNLIDLTLTGENNNDWFGYSISSGDINNDGISDVLIGAPLNDDNGIDAGKSYLYQFNQSSYSKSSSQSKIQNVQNPNQFRLFQNFPNPFNPTTQITFTLPFASKVTLKIFDTSGKEIITLINNEIKSEGYNSVNFNGGNLASGIYFYRIEADDFKETKKMILNK